MAMSDNIKDLMASAGVAGEDVALSFRHQANYRIINEARRRIPDTAGEVLHQDRPLRQHVFRECPILLMR